jgi:general secretion pathway protein L
MMAEFLVLRINKPATHGSWIAVDSAGNRITSLVSGELSAAAPAAAGRRLVVLVPGTEVVLTQTQLPVRSPAKIMQMLPYSLEERVAEDVDRLFFAAGQRDGDGNVTAAVVSRTLLESWLSSLEDAGLQPDAIYPDTQGVPRSPGSLNLVLDGPRVFVGVADHLPLVFEGLSISSALGVITADVDDQALQHIVVYCDAQDNERYADTWARLRDSVASLDVHVLPDGPLPRFAAELMNEPGVNLLQAGYTPRSDWQPLLRPWRAAAGFLLGLLILTVGVEAAELYSLSSRDKALSETLEARCLKVFPGSGSLSACRSQVEQRLGSNPSGGDGTNPRPFLNTLLSVGAAVGNQADLQSMNFRNGIMDLKIIAPNVETLDKIQRQVSSAEGLQAEIQSANPTDAGVEGRLQIKGVGQ